MHHAHSGVTVADLVAQDAHTHQIVDVVEVAALDDHLLVDRPVVLGPALDARVDLRRVERGGNFVTHLGQVGVTRRRPTGDQPDDLLVLLRMQDREGQVLQLPLHRRHAQPMCQWRNDFQRLPGLAGLLLRRQEPHGAHVVQSVGDLDHQHPPVAGHRDDHLADRLGVGRGPQRHFVELGDAVHQMGHFLTEVGGQLFHRVAGVLDRVVQQRGDQRGGVHAELGQDVGDGKRMGDVRVAGTAHLVGVPLLGHLVRLLQQRQVGLRDEALVHGYQRLQHRVDGAALSGHPAGQPGPHPP